MKNILYQSNRANAAEKRLTLPVTCDTDKLVKPLNAIILTQPALNASTAPPIKIHKGNLVIITTTYCQGRTKIRP